MKGPLKLTFHMIILLALILTVPSLSFSETTCKTENCMVTITVKIAFSGASDDQINNWKNDIENTWNGPNGYQTFGDCNCMVQFKVQTMKITNASQINCKPPPMGYHCVMVTPWNGTTESLPFFYNSTGQKEYVMGYMGYSTQSPSSGPSIDGWWSDQMNRPSPDGGNYHDAAHEVGHMMGLKDGSGGLMNFTSGEASKPNQQNIDEAVMNVCGKDACPKRCCCGNGVIDNTQGENCDPMASPEGCSANEFCCPLCCSCYQKKCNAQSGEHETQQQCESSCDTNSKCYYNYKTGCWDCLKQIVIEEIIHYDPTLIFQINEHEHGLSLDPSRFIGMKPLQGIPLGNMFANERIDVYVDEEHVGNIIFLDGEITEAGFEKLDKASMKMKMNKETWDDLESEETSIEMALIEKRIEIKGVGIGNSIKAGFANFGFWLYSLFD